MPKFNNKENKSVKTEDGRTVWLSRSCAVVITTLWVTPYGEARDHLERTKVLLVKRSNNDYNEPGRWCLPCGFLDYNETLYEAALRETYEETGIYIPDFTGISSEGDHQPWKVHSGLDDTMSNVSHHFGFIIPYEKEPTFHVSEKEIECARLVPVKGIRDYDIAFNHTMRIMQFININERRIMCLAQGR